MAEPYTKQENGEHWEITDGDNVVIATAQTETLADHILEALLGRAWPACDYQAGVPHSLREVKTELALGGYQLLHALQLIGLDRSDAADTLRNVCDAILETLQGAEHACVQAFVEKLQARAGEMEARTTELGGA